MSELFGHAWWLLLLAVIGLVALGTVLLNLFFSIGERVDSASMTEGCAVDSEAFLRGLAGTLNAPLQEGGSARVLNNGDEFFPCLLEGLRGAKHTINFLMYIWEPGEMSDRLREVLQRKAAEGVEVRVLVDSFGGHKMPEEQIDEMRRAGVRWEWFHPVRFGILTRLHKRNHRRAIIIDGKLGFTGGPAVHDQWLGNAQDPEHWRDCMIELRGGAATNLQSAFAQLWSHVTGEMLIGQRFFPHASGSEAEDASLGEPLSRHISVISSPSNVAHPLRRFFWLTFRAAQERLYITNPYFVPDDVMCAVLQDRARAGVDVRVLVPGVHIDLAIIRWASHSNYEAMLEAGLRIYEYQPTMIHQKLAVVDGKWSVVGTANLDVRSKELNQENVLGILDEGFAGELERVFFADLERAREIHLEEWRRRPLWWRARERVALLFEEQF